MGNQIIGNLVQYSRQIIINRKSSGMDLVSERQQLKAQSLAKPLITQTLDQSLLSSASHAKQSHPLTPDPANNPPPTLLQQWTLSLTIILPLMLTLCLSGFYFGYIVVYLTSVSYPKIKQYYGISWMEESLAQGVLNGVISVGGGVGCLLSQGVMKWYSRRYALLATNFLAIFANLLLFIPQVIILIFARLLQGICIGLYTAIVPLFIREISPLCYAGTVGVLFQFFMAFGTVFCYLFAFVMGRVLGDVQGDNVWWIVFGFPLVTLVMQSMLMGWRFRYETPKYLLENGRDQECRELLGNFYRQQRIEEVFQVLKDQSIDKCPYPSAQTTQPQKPPTLSTISAFFMSFSQQMIGLGAVVIYGSQVSSKVLPKLSSYLGFLINSPQLVGSMALSYLLMRYERKMILQVGMTIIVGLNVVMGVGFLAGAGQNGRQQEYGGYGQWEQGSIGSQEQGSNAWGYIILCSQLLYNLIYAGSAGSMLWIYLPALLAPSYLPVGNLLNWLSSSLVLILFPLIQQNLLNSNPGWLFIFFSVYTFVALIIYQKIVIEIKGKSQQQIWQQYRKMSKSKENQI